MLQLLPKIVWLSSLFSTVTEGRNDNNGFDLVISAAGYRSCVITLLCKYTGSDVGQETTVSNLANTDSETI